MSNYIKIQPIQFGELKEKTANAIMWYVTNLPRNADSAVVNCTLINIIDSLNSSYVSSFVVEIDNVTLQSWGADDSVIDDAVLAYSPLFIKDTTI